MPFFRTDTTLAHGPKHPHVAAYGVAVCVRRAYLTLPPRPCRAIGAKETLQKSAGGRGLGDGQGGGEEARYWACEQPDLFNLSIRRINQ